jgi:hypothetical protein
MARLDLEYVLDKQISGLMAMAQLDPLTNTFVPYTGDPSSSSGGSGPLVYEPIVGSRQVQTVVSGAAVGLQVIPSTATGVIITMKPSGEAGRDIIRFSVDGTTPDSNSPMLASIEFDQATFVIERITNASLSNIKLLYAQGGTDNQIILDLVYTIAVLGTAGSVVVPSPVPSSISSSANQVLEIAALNAIKDSSDKLNVLDLVRDDNDAAFYEILKTDSAGVESIVYIATNEVPNSAISANQPAGGFQLLRPSRENHLALRKISTPPNILGASGYSTLATAKTLQTIQTEVGLSVTGSVCIEVQNTGVVDIRVSLDVALASATYGLVIKQGKSILIPSGLDSIVTLIEASSGGQIYLILHDRWSSVLRS